MSPVLKNTYDYFENIRGRRLVILLVLLLIIFVPLGILLGQLPNLLEGGNNTEEAVTETQQKKEELVEKSGKVVYSDPALFPKDEISYKLIDSDGKLVILLTSDDDKLKVIEGSTVRLMGNLQKASDGSDVLNVEQVVFK